MNKGYFSVIGMFRSADFHRIGILRAYGSPVDVIDNVVPAFPGSLAVVLLRKECYRSPFIEEGCTRWVLWRERRKKG